MASLVYVLLPMSYSLMGTERIWCCDKLTLRDAASICRRKAPPMCYFCQRSVSRSHLAWSGRMQTATTSKRPYHVIAYRCRDSKACAEGTSVRLLSECARIKRICEK